jgi:hypothetical protein
MNASASSRTLDTGDEGDSRTTAGEETHSVDTIDSNSLPGRAYPEPSITPYKKTEDAQRFWALGKTHTQSPQSQFAP